MIRKFAILTTITVVTLLIGAASPVVGASPEPWTTLVKDIYPGTYDSSPSRLTNVSGTLFFMAKDTEHGNELWKSDGTPAGTMMVKDIYPSYPDSAPTNLTDVNGTLFFAANTPNLGFELWKSDGTAAGTVMVKDINSGLSGSIQPRRPHSFANVNGTLFFAANGGGKGTELWKSDGTIAGTIMVKDINPGWAGSSPNDLTEVNGTLFFVADDGSKGYELWKSDGTTTGTVRVKDINPGSGDSFQRVYDQSPYYRALINVNGTLFARAHNGSDGVELWKSDGTAAGTSMVKNIHPTSSSYPGSFEAVNSVLFFTADDGTNGFELWRSDGTTAGTIMVKDIHSTSSSYPIELTEAGGTLFFRADDGTNGNELWKSDGTAAGTDMVKNIRPGSGDSHPPPYSFSLTNVKGTLFFLADDGDHGDEIWKSDGTVAGTVMVKDVYPGTTGSSLESFVNVNDTLFFAADDGLWGAELWKSDGTTEGTVMAKDCNPYPFDSSPKSLTSVNGNLFFTADDGEYGEEVWMSDGSPTGTFILDDIGPDSEGSRPVELTDSGGTLFFIATHPKGSFLWSADYFGWPSKLQKFDRPKDGYAPETWNLTDVNGTLFLTAYSDSYSGWELWQSDGTDYGTVKVSDLGWGTRSLEPKYLTDVNGTLFFAHYSGSYGYELWKSDANPFGFGTAMLKDINPTVDSNPGELTNVNGTLFFAADDGSKGTELWKSDGTAAGTLMVKDINAGYEGSSLTNLTDVNGTLFFAARTGGNGTELWKSDGTTSGTVMVKDIYPGPTGSFPTGLTNVNGTLFFTADDGTYNSELWKSDGTAAGTVMVKDIHPTSFSYPNHLTKINGTLFFAADDGEHGLELWESDGTTAGTVMVKDISPGSADSLPRNLTNVNGTLFFTANDGVTGEELWKCVPDANAGILIEKFTNGEDADDIPGPYVPVGAPIIWEYVVTNTGDIPLENVTVADSDPSIVINSPKTTLAPGESMIAWGNGTATPGQYANTATADGTPSGGITAITDADSSHYFGVDLSIDIELHTNGQDADIPPGPYILVGDTVYLQYTVTNNGNFALGNITVTDDTGVSISIPKDTLAPGESVVGWGNSTAAPELHYNAAGAVGMAQGGPGAAEDWDVSHYFGASPSIVIEKHTNGTDADDAPGLYIHVGAPVIWEYIVTNTGDVPLTSVTVTDSDPEVLINSPKTTLAPGESMVAWANGIATAGQNANTGTAAGTPPGGLGPVNGSDSSHYFGADLSIDIETLTNGQDADTPPGPYILVGDPVFREYIVTNTGNVPLIDVTVRGEKGVVLNSPTNTLEPGESMVLSGNSTAVPEQQVTAAEVFGVAPGDLGAVEDWDASHYFGISPSIDIEKFTNGIDADQPPGLHVPVGGLIVWEYVVTNTGDVTLTNITVTDSDPGVIVDSPITTLAPGESMVAVSRSTAVAGQYENVGTATGTPPGGLDPVIDTDRSHYFGFEGPPPPAIGYEPGGGLRFRSREGEGGFLEKVLIIANTGEPGCAPLEWNISDDADWLALSATGGVLECGEEFRIIVTADTAGAVAGEYYATIFIEAPGATNTPQEIEVVLAVMPGKQR